MSKGLQQTIQTQKKQIDELTQLNNQQAEQLKAVKVELERDKRVVAKTNTRHTLVNEFSKRWYMIFVPFSRVRKWVSQAEDFITQPL